jgi:hypothetical protein
MKCLPFALLLGMSAFQVQAQTSEATVSGPSGTDEKVVVAADEDVEVHYGDVKVIDEKSRCVRDTGSRIKRRETKICNGQPGRSYDRDDLDSTGAIDTADALRRLDPSIGR